MMEPTNVKDSAKLADLATVRGLEDFNTVAEQTGLETVGDLRSAAFERLMGTSEVLDVSFVRGTVGSSEAKITIEAGPLDTHVDGDELDLTLKQFASRLETDELALAGGN